MAHQEPQQQQQAPAASAWDRNDQSAMAPSGQQSAGDQAMGGLVEERVKVDRKRFEQMLSDASGLGGALAGGVSVPSAGSGSSSGFPSSTGGGGSGASGSASSSGGSHLVASQLDADSFFRRVMRSTNTQIMWPPKLKPGTKSKKDPHVRITGSPNSINAAKEIIFEQLDTRRNRVTLKMDVAFTDHSHIIGKGGRSIQRVMDETGCHIHFPDSNRTNTAEKSNQVSIAGSAEGVEQSRHRIREMLPITVQFDLPLNNGLHSPPTLDPQSPQLQAIQQSYGVTVAFRSDTSSKSCHNQNNSYFASSRIITVAVRGARSHLYTLRQGLAVLIEYLTGFRANSINVPLTMTIDVAVQHHSFISGRGNCNIRQIMQATGAVITMPDVNNLLLGGGPAAISTHSLESLDSLISTSNNNSSTNINSLANSLTSLNTLGSSGSTSSLPPGDPTASYGSVSNGGGGSGSGGNLSASASLSGSASSLINGSSSIHGNTSICGGGGHGSQLQNSRKTAIQIKGQNFESVYSAWQELLGYLPLILIFDLKEGQDLDPIHVTRLMDQMRHITILIKPKQRQNTKSIVVRGPERESLMLFEVRRQILALDEASPLVNLSSSLPNLAKFASLASGFDQQQHQQQLFGSMVMEQQQSSGSSKYHSHHQQSHTPNNNNNQNDGIVTNPSTNLQRNQQNQLVQQQSSNENNNNIINNMLTSSLTNLDCNNNSNNNKPSTPELQMRAIRSILEPNLDKTRQPTPYWAGLGFSKSVSEPMLNDRPLIGQLFTSNLLDQRRTSYANNEARALHDHVANNLQSLTLKDLQQHQQQQHSQSHLNHHHHHQNTNHHNLQNRQQQQHNDQQQHQHQEKDFIDTNNNSGSTSSTSNNSRPATSSTPSSNVNTQSQLNNNQKITSCLKLAVFLGRIQLVQYLGLFTQHNIDLETLFTLTEEDFADLGLSYIHRRRLAIAIAEVKSSIQNDQSNLSSTFDAAPGAERSKRHKSRGSLVGELSDIWST